MNMSSRLYSKRERDKKKKVAKRRRPRTRPKKKVSKIRKFLRWFVVFDYRCFALLSTLYFFNCNEF